MDEYNPFASDWCSYQKSSQLYYGGCYNFKKANSVIWKEELLRIGECDRKKHNTFATGKKLNIVVYVANDLTVIDIWRGCMHPLLKDFFVKNIGKFCAYEFLTFLT